MYVYLFVSTGRITNIEMVEIPGLIAEFVF